MRVVARLRDQFNIELPLRSLFEAPSIGQLAERLSGIPGNKDAPRDSTPAHRDALVKIQVGSGSSAPLFFVHAAGGTVHCYYELSRHLGSDQEVFGIEAIGLYGSEPPLMSFSEMAARYVEQIRAACPNGPYLIAGWSLGGVIAFEIARQLRADGKSVELLALIDSFPGNIEDVQPDKDQNHWMSFIRELRLDGIQFSNPSHPFWTLQTDAKLSRLSDQIERSEVASGLFQEIRSHYKVFRANEAAWRDYMPSPFDGRTVLFRSRDHGAISSLSEETWSKVSAGGCESFFVPGDHFSLLQQPHVRVLGELIKSVIARRSVPG
jgi:thioesterase domain-containing protein